MSMRIPNAEKIRFHAALGRKIREHRDRVGLTQRKVAELLGLTASALDKYEDGTTAAPSYVVWRIAHILDCTTDDLMVDVASR